MKLHEYQSKQIFSNYGIPIPSGRVATNAADVKRIAEELGRPVVIKSQVLVGGRGKAGGIRLAKSPQEAEDLAFGNEEGDVVHRQVIAELLGQFPYFNHGCRLSLSLKWTAAKRQHPVVTVVAPGTYSRWRLTIWSRVMIGMVFTGLKMAGVSTRFFAWRPAKSWKK